MPDMCAYSCPTNQFGAEYWRSAIWQIWLEHTCASDDAKKFVYESWTAGRLKLIIDSEELKRRHHVQVNHKFEEVKVNA
jgi:hypothetical protein